MQERRDSADFFPQLHVKTPAQRRGAGKEGENSKRDRGGQAKDGGGGKQRCVC